jgi:hypothetical protein
MINTTVENRTGGETRISIEQIGTSALSKEGDSSFAIFRVEPTDKFDELHGDEAIRGLIEYFGYGSCSHEHDCCGCWNHDYPRIIHQDKSYGFYLIRQDAHRNI